MSNKSIKACNKTFRNLLRLREFSSLSLSLHGSNKFMKSMCNVRRIEITFKQEYKRNPSKVQL